MNLLRPFETTLYGRSWKGSLVMLIRGFDVRFGEDHRVASSFLLLNGFMQDEKLVEAIQQAVDDYYKSEEGKERFKDLINSK
jgi:hypothetical protein